MTLHSARLRPLVLLHGLGTGPSGWLPQVQAFSAGREVLTPSFRGAGPFSFDAASQQLADELWDRGPVDVCGLSLGALVGLRFAADRPEQVARLAVCAGFLRLPRRFRAFQAVAAGMVRLLPAGSVRKSLVSQVPEAYRAEALESIGDLTSREAARLMVDGARFDLSGRAQDVAMPVLVLCGERDRINLSLSRTLAAALPDARLAVVPGAGHVANLDNPDAFNRLLREFLAD
jgi:3-oxoadipate enol-lactonase